MVVKTYSCRCHISELRRNLEMRNVASSCVVRCENESRRALVSPRCTRIERNDETKDRERAPVLLTSHILSLRI